MSLAPEGKAKIHVLFICQAFYKIFLQIIFARAQKNPAGGQGWVVSELALGQYLGELKAPTLEFQTRTRPIVCGQD
jgi:hypothetical protein